jgi:lipid-A-disaccharide synthase
MRYYVIAGERSGDLHAGNLVKAIKRLDDNSQFRGFGGEYMKEAGVNLVATYSEIAFMGFLEVFKNLNTISKYIKKCKADILENEPDVIVLIDFGGFNKQIAAFGKKHGIKVFYYITPKVWAWYQSRAYDLKKTVDHMFVILPFEKDFFKKFEWDVDYVGNPVLDAVKAHQPNEEFLNQHQLDKTIPLIALLPGSRRQELIRMIPIMSNVVKQFPHLQFAVAAVNNLGRDLYAQLAELKNVRFIYEDTYNLLLNSSAAIVTSGTATLETALFKIPQVVVYKTSYLSYKIAKTVINVPYISLVNLIAGKQVIKELIQKNATVDSIAAELNALVFDKAYRNKILADYENIFTTLDTGSASENTARLMVQYLKE